jgi:hypothetical protein
MARLKVHYEGWLALPPDMRRRLGVATGGELEAELVGGTIVLRQAVAKAAPKREAEKAATVAATAVAAPPVLAVVNEEAEPAPAAAPVPASLALPATAKRRGRPPKVRQQA